MSLNRPLCESVVVITGASSGIGAATSLALARRGMRLALAARDRQSLDDIADRCRQFGAPVIVVPTDTADPEAVERLAATAENRYGRIDAWINNAAVALYGGLIDVPLDEIHRTIEVNLYGYLYGARAAVPRLRAAGGGVLVNVGSMLSEVTFPYLGAYNIAKHGMLGLCDTLRQELHIESGAKVSVCSILPGSVDTPLFSRAANHTGSALRPPPPVTSPSRVAERIVGLLQHPRRRVRVGPGSSALDWQARLAPAATERLLEWYGRRAQFVAGSTAAASSGNLFTPTSGPVQVAGGWRRSARVAVTAGTAIASSALAQLRRRSGVKNGTH